MVSSRLRLGGWRSPVVLVVIGLLVVSYVVVGILLNVSGGGNDVFALLALDPDAVLHHGQVWRLLSYGLLHDPSNPFHVLMNALMLFFFGRDLERRYGPARFVAFLVGAVLAGGVAVTAVSPFFHHGAIGFSGAVEACTVVWALQNRNAQVLLFFAVPMRGIHMLWLAVAMWLFDAVSVSNVSAAAHFGGIVFGLAVYFATARRNRISLFVDDLLVKLHLKKRPRLTVVPKNDRWVN